MAAQKVTKISLAEIYKRVPPNQIQKFLHFRNKNAQYKRRVNKHPEFLPKIDWDYYRNNVRTEYCKMVDDFEKKYEELNEVFDCRHQLDTKSYFKDVDKQRIAVKSEVEAYIVESNKRIKVYEDEIKRIKSMLPYDQMTCEEFVIACPDKAPLIGCGEQPTFWPHVPEEQTPGPASPQAHEELARLLHEGDPKQEPEATPLQEGTPPAAGGDTSTKATAVPPAEPATSSQSAQEKAAKARERQFIKAEEAKRASAAKDAKDVKKVDAEIEAAKKTVKSIIKEVEKETGVAIKTAGTEAKKQAEKVATELDAALKTTKAEAVPPKQPDASKKPTKSDNSTSTPEEKNPKDKGQK